MICSFNFRIFLAVCLNISTLIYIQILTNSNQQIQSYKFTSHIAAFLSVVLITEMLEICIQTWYDQNVQLILKSYLPVVYGITLIIRQVWSNRQTSGESASLPQYLGCNTVFDMRLRVTFLRRKTVSLLSNIAHRK